MLELLQLEERSQPSFLLAGTVNSFLVPPLSAMVADQQQATADLQFQFTTLQNFFVSPANTVPGANTVVSRMVGDWQRVLTDRAAVTAVAAADTLFIQAAARATASEGDPIDMLVLQFGPAFGFNPLAPLASLSNQANAAVSNPQSQFIVNSNLQAFNPFVSSPVPIAQTTVAVNFAIFVFPGTFPSPFPGG